MKMTKTMDAVIKAMFETKKLPKAGRRWRGINPEKSNYNG